jgi:phage protein U
MADFLDAPEIKFNRLRDTAWFYGDRNVVFMILGEGKEAVLFSVNGVAYESLQRSSAWRWAKMPRIGRLPGRQSLGPDDDAIELAGTIITERSGFDGVTRIRNLMATGKPQRLCDSFGYVLGMWCIESVQETQSNLHIDGLPRKQTFSVSLSIYGEDTRQFIETPDQAAVDRWERNRAIVEATA